MFTFDDNLNNCEIFDSCDLLSEPLGENRKCVLRVSRCFEITLQVGKASLTSQHTCTYVLVTEKIGLFARDPCDFITKSQGCTDPAMEIDMRIFSACTQCVH